MISVDYSSTIEQKRVPFDYETEDECYSGVIVVQEFDDVIEWDNCPADWEDIEPMIIEEYYSKILN